MGKSQITRKQMLSNAVIERRKARDRVIRSENQSKSIVGGSKKQQQQKGMTNEMMNERIEESILSSALDRIASLLPKGDNKRPRMQFVSKRDKRPWMMLPFTPLKKNVCWLDTKAQDARHNISLSEEIAKFANYVEVRKFVWILFLNNFFIFQFICSHRLLNYLFIAKLHVFSYKLRRMTADAR